MAKFRLPLEHAFDWAGQVSVSLPSILSTDQRTFPFEGTLILRFEESEHEGLARISIIGDVVELPSISLTRGRGPRIFREMLTIGEQTLETASDQLMDCQGYLDIATGAFTLQFRREITTEEIPILRVLGTGALQFLVQQAGTIDLESQRITSAHGKVTTSNEDRSGVAAFFSKGCSTWISLSASLDGSQPNKSESVYILEGEDVHLWWESSEDVQTADLSPEIGNVPGAGHELIRNINESVTYEITTVDGDCERKDKVEINVVRKGSLMPLTAPYIPSFELFHYTFEKQFCSNNIMVEYIEPRCGKLCYEHFWKQGNYLNCDGVYCVGEWNGFKKSIGGGMPYPFGVGLMKNPLSPAQQAVGVWDFLPQTTSGDYDGSSAHFYLTVK